MEETAERVTVPIRVARPGRIVAYYPETQRADVQYVHDEARTNTDGMVEVVAAPIAYGLPVAMLSGGGTSITFGLAAGDRVWVIIRDQSGDEYDAGRTEETYLPADPRRWDLADGVVWPMSDPPSRVDGDPVITMRENGVLRIGSSAASLALARADKVDARLDAIVTAYNAHQHSGVTVGGGVSGNATNGIAGVNDTGCDRVLVDS